MNNLIERLRQFVEEYKDKENKFNQKYMEDDLIIPYKQAEFIIETIELLQTSCRESDRWYQMILDYNRLLKKENDELKGLLNDTER